jgi:hypothetical protein
MAVKIDMQVYFEQFLFILDIQLKIPVQELDLSSYIGEAYISIVCGLPAVLPGVLDREIQFPRSHFDVDPDIGLKTAFACPMLESILNEGQKKQRRNLLFLVVDLPYEFYFESGIIAYLFKRYVVSTTS